MKIKISFQSFFRPGYMLNSSATLLKRTSIEYDKYHGMDNNIDPYGFMLI